jgi:hypothetical protein
MGADAQHMLANVSKSNEGFRFLIGRVSLTKGYDVT